MNRSHNTMITRYLTIALLLSLPLLTHCSPKEDICSGDLIFVVEPLNGADGSDMSGAIIGATSSSDLCATHVGIIKMISDSVKVIDATTRHGVSIRSVEEFSNECAETPGSKLVIMRVIAPFDKEAAIRRAEELSGRGYDFTFLPDNENFYCSELVQQCYLNDEGKPLFESKPMNFKDSEGNFPDFWTKLFNELDMPIPQDVPGTNPNDMMHDAQLVKIKEIEVR